MNKVSLSASRIKTAQSCSWLYWSKYHLKIPDKSNDGANRGTVAHEVFELLGDPKNKKDYDKIITKQDVFASVKIKNLITSLAKKLKVDDEANLKIIKDYTLNGLMFDFFGEAKGKIKESHSEKDFEFDINENGLNYKVKGFIDKLFIYEDNSAIIRDFKSSKEKFKGKDLEDNLQDLMYVLAVRKMFPEVKRITTEFLFLKFSDGLIPMPELSDIEIQGFEQQLSFIQTYLDNFNEKIAVKKLAARADYPKDDSFSGPLMCGRAKSPGQIKKDGTPMWHCSAKFAFDYFQIKDENNVIIDSCYKDDKKEYIEKHKDKKIKFELFQYSGCPAHCK
jgi:hypothetical protein